MDMKEILEDFKKDLEKAKSDMKTAKEMIAMGEEMGIDVAKRRAEVRDTEMKIARFEAVIEKRLAKQK